MQVRANQNSSTGDSGTVTACYSGTTYEYNPSKTGNMS